MIDKYLLSSVRLGHAEGVREAIRKGGDPNALAEHGEYRALHAAAMGGYSEVCQVLIEAGARVDAGLDDGCRRTSLHLAAGKGFTQVCRVLIDAGADVNCAGPVECTPLLYAAGASNVQCVVLLLEAGADINAVDKFGANAAYWVVKGLTEVAFASFDERVETLRVLVERGIDLDRPTRGGTTALKKAVEHAAGRLIIPLVQLGADPGFIPGGVSAGYLTPFQKTIALANFDAARELALRHGQDLRQRTLSGKALADVTPDAGSRDQLLSLVTEVDIAHSVAPERPGHLAEIEGTTGRGADAAVLGRRKSFSLL